MIDPFVYAKRSTMSGRDGPFIPRNCVLSKQGMPLGGPYHQGLYSLSDKKLQDEPTAVRPITARSSSFQQEVDIVAASLMSHSKMISLPEEVYALVARALCEEKNSLQNQSSQQQHPIDLLVSDELPEWKTMNQAPLNQEDWDVLFKASQFPDKDTTLIAVDSMVRMNLHHEKNALHHGTMKQLKETHHQTSLMTAVSDASDINIPSSLTRMNLDVPNILMDDNKSKVPSPVTFKSSTEPFMILLDEYGSSVGGDKSPLTSYSDMLVSLSRLESNKIKRVPWLSRQTKIC